MTGPYGPDVSVFQGVIDWDKVVAPDPVTGQKVEFAACKATEGSHTVDTQFAYNWSNMRRVGLPVRVAYHYGHPGNDPLSDAQHFVSTVGSFQPGEMVMLDIETSDSQGPAAVAAWCKTWCDKVASLAGLPKQRITVYTGAWFWNPQAGGSSSVGDHPLWVSGYVPSNPPMPGGWSGWTFWQYTDKAAIQGIKTPVDCSRFNGTVDQLHALAGIPQEDIVATIDDLGKVIDDKIWGRLCAPVPGQTVQPTFGSLIDNWQKYRQTGDIAAAVVTALKASGVLAGSVDTAAIAKAVADEIASRLAS